MQIAEIALKWLTKWIAGRCESSKARLEHFYPPRVLSRRLIAFSRKMVSQSREPLPIDMKDPLSGQTTAERASPNELGIGKGTNHPMPRQNASFTWTQTLRMPHVGEIAIQEMPCRCAVKGHWGGTLTAGDSTRSGLPTSAPNGASRQGESTS